LAELRPVSRPTQAADQPGGHHSAPWPYRLLDVAALHADGWSPTPFREFILKVHQRCNLACDYCYVYAHADQSWRRKPLVMDDAVLAAAAERIGAHVARHRQDAITVILHGGEPLLAGAARLAHVVETVRSRLPAGTGCAAALQTNGVLLTDDVLQVMRTHGISVGVSLDGSAAVHDLHRRGTDGRSTSTAVAAALTRLRRPENRQIYAGVLAVIDPAGDPVETYESLLAHEPPSIDLLLPHASWSAPPLDPDGSRPDFGTWLVRVFDRWYDAPRRETGIRFFEEVVHGVLGGAGRHDGIGLSPVAAVVIESDGGIEQADSLKVAYDGGAATGLSVWADSLDDALHHPGFVARQIAGRALGDRCRRCAVARVCGGGHYAHRYRAGSGFRHSSVYCDDLMRLIRHVHRRLHHDLSLRIGTAA
jgi:uncharacterized protein